MKSSYYVQTPVTATRRILFGVTLTVLWLLGMSAQAASGDGDGSSDSNYGSAQSAISEENYQQAVENLRQALADSPDDADVLNLLGFSYRKLGDVDQAFDYYQQALAIDPEHRGANEYLGELYLETGQLEKAQERLEVLDGACFFGCLELDELKEEIENYRAAKGI